MIPHASAHLRNSTLKARPPLLHTVQGHAFVMDAAWRWGDIRNAWQTSIYFLVTFCVLVEGSRCHQEVLPPVFHIANSPFHIQVSRLSLRARHPDCPNYSLLDTPISMST